MSSPISLPTGNPLVTLTHRMFRLIFGVHIDVDHHIFIRPAKPSLWILELHHGLDNRLTQQLINKGVMPALDVVEREWREQQRAAVQNKKLQDGAGALIIVGKRDQDKFFSNGNLCPHLVVILIAYPDDVGLDFANSTKDPNFFQLTFNPMLARLLTFPSESQCDSLCA